MKTITDESLKNLFLSNSDIKQNILSFYFGNEDKIQSLYNQFYSTQDLAKISIYFTKCHKTQWLCDKIIEIYPYKFTLVPISMITSKMALQVVKRMPRYLSHVPSKFLTIDFCKQMIEYYPQTITKTCLEVYLWKIAIINDPYTVIHMPPNDCMRELWQMAVVLDVYLIRCMPIDFYSRELCITVIKIHPPLILTFPSIYHTQEMYEIAVMIDPTMISQVPLYYLTMDFCSRLVSRDISMIDKIPWKKMS